MVITYTTFFMSVESVDKWYLPFSFNLHEETREQLTELQVKLKDAVDQLVSSFACEFEEGIQKNVLEMGRLLHRVSVTVDTHFSPLQRTEWIKLLMLPSVITGLLL